MMNEALSAIFGPEAITVVCSAPSRLHSQTSELVTFFHPDPGAQMEKRWEPIIGSTREGRERGGPGYDGSGRLVLRCYQCHQTLRVGHFDRVSWVLTQFWSRGITRVPIYKLRSAYNLIIEEAKAARP